MRILKLFTHLFWIGLFMAGFSLSVPAEAIPWSDVGAKATAEYHGDGLEVSPGSDDAWLHCRFQKLDAHATSTGLWLDSTVSTRVQDHFQVRAQALGRNRLAPLSATGQVSTSGKLVRLVRPQVTEEYSVSMDGVRQDFVIAIKPEGEGQLQLTLALTGAQAETAVDGIQLTLDNSNRKLAYNRLQAEDATGRKLKARLTVAGPDRLLVTVEDQEAVYPVRIDPTFSDANWTSLGGYPGANAGVDSIVSDNTTGKIYVSGSFRVVANTTANYVAEWNGTSWVPLGGGLNGEVHSLAISGTNLYAGGYFFYATNGTTGIKVNCFAKWNGKTWSAVGAGFDSLIYHIAIASDNTTIYVGGHFIYATNSTTGVRVNHIAKWNGTAWSAVGNGFNDDVDAILINGSTVYAGGSLTFATNSSTGVRVNHIAKWNGTSWSALGSGFNNYVNSLALIGTTLYAGGGFSYFTNTTTGTRANYIAKWNGTTWSVLKGGLSYYVGCLYASGTNLYVGGAFTYTYVTNNNNTPDITAPGIALWNGSSWATLKNGLRGGASAINLVGTNLYVGGTFSGSDSVASSDLIIWDGAAWHPPGGSGLQGGVTACAFFNGDLYASGPITIAGTNYVNGLCKWNGSTWAPVGGGVGGSIQALAVDGNNLYVGGNFLYVTNSDGTSLRANDVAAWNGSSWSALGDGFNGIVNALAVSGTNLYAGGGQSSTLNSYIGEWNGATWSDMGASLDNQVEALAASGTNLYVAGYFTKVLDANDTPIPGCKGIAQWDGNSWSSVGYGTSSFVEHLAVMGTNLYIAGGFLSVTNGNGAAVPAAIIAKWNGSSWSALGGGIYNNSYANAMQAINNVLYVGGMITYVTNAGPMALAVNNIAAWDGTNWFKVGTGANSTVNAMATAYGNLYVGGYFTTAGTNVSSYVAQYGTETPVLELTSSNLAAATYGSTFNYAITTPNNINNFGASGLPPGLTVDSASGIISGQPTQSGTYAATITATNGWGYGMTNLMLTVDPATLTVSGLTASNKIYDGTTVAHLDFDNATLQGIVFNDAVSLNPAGYTANFASPNAGNELAVSASGLALVGVAATNYIVAQPTGLVANILPAPVAVTLNRSVQLYDGSAKSVSATTLPPELPLNITYNGSATAPSASAAYAVVATVTNLNYTGSATNQLYIAPQPQLGSITAANGKVSFTWDALSDVNYHVFETTSLTPPVTWTDLFDTVSATNNIMTESATLSTTNNRFYRVELMLQ